MKKYKRNILTLSSKLFAQCITGMQIKVLVLNISKLYFDLEENI